MSLLQKELERTLEKIGELEEEIEDLREYEQRLRKNISSGINLNTPLSQFDDFPDLHKVILVGDFYGYTELTVEELLSLSDKEFLRVRGFGEKTLNDINSWIEKKGLIKTI